MICYHFLDVGANLQGINLSSPPLLYPASFPKLSSDQRRICQGSNAVPLKSLHKFILDGLILSNEWRGPSHGRNQKGEEGKTASHP